MKKNLKDKKSLNIAMLGHKRIPSREGGIEIVVEELATAVLTLAGAIAFSYIAKAQFIFDSIFVLVITYFFQSKEQYKTDGLVNYAFFLTLSIVHRLIMQKWYYKTIL